MSVTNKQLREAASRMINARKFDTWLPGLMGKPDAGGFIYDVPGTALTWVRITTLTDDVIGTAKAYNDAGIDEDGALAIWLERNIEGTLSIVQIRRKGM